MIHSTNKNQRLRRNQAKRDQANYEVTRSTGKIIITIFWHCEDVLLVDFLPCCTTINGPYYASFPCWLRSSIREKHRRKLRCGALLLHDNAPVHKSNITLAAYSVYKVDRIESSCIYSPDVAPSNYHLFSNLKNFLRGGEF